MNAFVECRSERHFTKEGPKCKKILFKATIDSILLTTYKIFETKSVVSTPVKQLSENCFLREIY